MLTERIGCLVIRVAEQRPELREGRVGKALDAGSTIPVPGGGGGEGGGVGVDVQRLAGLESQRRKRRRNADNVFVTFTCRGNWINHHSAGVMEPAVAEVAKIIKGSAAAAQAGNDPFFLAPLEAEEPAEEPVSEPVDEPAAMFTAEEPAVEAAAVPEPEMPAPPQPALEELVAGIDHALESAPAIAAAEPAAPTVHKQYSQLDDYVVFSLAGSDYAVPVRDVAEIGRVPGITRVPNVPDFMRGITNLRGEVVPVINLPGLLGLQDSAPSARGRVLFLQARERVSPTGLMVDEVKGIQRIQSQQLEQVTGLVDDKVTSVLRGVHGRGDRLLNVLDLEQLFGLQEFEQLASR